MSHAMLRYVIPGVEEERARKRLHRTSLRYWRRELPGLPYLELVWLPSYRMIFTVDGTRRSGDVEALVGGCDGSLKLCDLSESLSAGVIPEGGRLPAALQPHEAQVVARQQLTALLLRAPGWQRRAELGTLRKCELIHYPYWAYYFERRRGLLDVRILDATNGERTGGKMKTTFLAALALADS